MRFDYLHLIAFGHFTDFKLEFDKDKNFHILYGPNETGKSTILRAVSNFLYGFPQQTDDSFLHDNQKLRIGGQLSNKQGETLEFIRRKGRKNTVLDVDNQAKNGAEVQKFLSGLQQEQFRNMFALDHVRLREGGESLLQSEGDVGESIFTAASGISVLREVLQELEKTSRDLYLKSGSKPPINEALREEKDLTKKINENQLRVQQWKQLEQDFLDGETEIKEIKDKIETLSTEEMKYRRLKQTLPKIALRREVITNRDELDSVPDLGEDAEEIRKENIAKLEAAQNKQEEATAEINEIDQDLEKLSIPENLLKQEAMVEGLNREVDGYRKNREELPVLKGEYQQLKQRVLSALKEIDPENTELEAVEKYRIAATQKKEIMNLANHYPLLMQRRKTAQKEVAEVKQDLEKQKNRLHELGEVVETISLEQAIDQVRKVGNIEEAIEETEQEITALEREITDFIRRLPLWKGTSEELKQLQVPSLRNSLTKYNKEYHELTGDLQQINQRIEREQRTIEEKEERMEELESLAKIPTEEVLETLRTYRNEGWLIVRNQLNQKQVEDETIEAFTKGLPLDLAFENSMKEADDTADIMRQEAEKLGEKNKLVRDIETSKINAEKLIAKKLEVEQALDTWQQAWEAEWDQAGITPLSPEEMLEWLEQYNTILERISKQEDLHQDIQSLTVKRDASITSLRAVLKDFATLPDEMTLTELLQKAQHVQNEIQENNSNRKHAQSMLDDLETKLHKAVTNEKEVEEEITNWESDWKHALDGASFGTTKNPDVVKNLMDHYDTCLHDYDELRQVEERINRMEEEMDTFHEKVQGLEQESLQSSDDHAMDVIVTQIYEALNKAKQDIVKRENLNDQKESLEREKLAASREIKEAEATLDHLLEQAGCTSLEELEKVEADYNKKKDYTEKIAELEEELIAVGDGLSLEQLLEEAKDADIDKMDHELAEIERQKAELDQSRSEVEQQHGVVKEEYKQKIEGTNDESMKMAEEKESVLARISDLTDDYVNHKLASLLLKRGIDYYRDENQSPIMDRASVLFNQLTQYSFDGMIVDFDEKDQPVMMGIRNGDEKVELSGMSDGTTDQLYLALRIASIEKYVSENEPIPFIVDDILIHFDDERAKETLKVLLDLSQKTQVIFFTHHSRLIELMNEVANEHEFQETLIEHSRTGVFS
jgi:uncharacterized protein YhaN